MIASLALLSTAYAQVVDGQTPEINAQAFRPTVDGRGTLWTDDASMPGFGASARFLLSYTDSPLVYVVDGQDELGIVRNLVQADVLAGIGLGPLRLGFDLPVYLFARGDVGAGEGGLGDVAADGKLTLFGKDAPIEAPIDIAAQGRVAFPTATVQTALGAPGVGYEAALIVSRKIDRTLLAVNAGTRVAPAADLENISIADAFVWRAGVGYDIGSGGGVAGEVIGQATYAAPLANPAGLPIEAMLSGYARAGENVMLRAGVGRGLTSGISSPDLRVVLGLAVEPRGEAKDSDNDGIVDRSDGCPQQAEDLDLFEDGDGCPDTDNDRDGVLDRQDTCPLDPEDVDSYKDRDGCPDPNTMATLRVVDHTGRPLDLSKGVLQGPDIDRTFSGGELALELPPGTYTLAGRAGTYEPNTASFEIVPGGPQTALVMLTKQQNVLVSVSRDRIDLKDKVYFETSSAQIKPSSHGLLEQAIQIVRDYPEIALLRIEGHTDKRGSDSYNLELSKQRAASVMAYFIDQGIDPSRLTSEGFGETSPLDPADTQAAHSKNRRVDFFIERWVDQD